MMSDNRRTAYSGGEHDRHNNARIDEDYIAEKLRHPSAAYCLFDSKLRLLLTSDGVKLPRWFTSFDARSLLEGNSTSVDGSSSATPNDTDHPALFLGTDAGATPFCAIRLENTENFPANRFKDLRLLAHILPHSVLALIAHARSLFAFHDNHRFCGLCGDRTISEQGGARRRCVRNTDRVRSEHVERDQRRCRGTWYPRIDPAVIMLIVDQSGERVLLARQKRFPRTGSYVMYSCLAGHMEHGESVEDSVRRETFEEVGITLNEFRCFGSQPWPFPYTLMLACVVQAKTEEIVIDKNELEDALWISRLDLHHMVQARGRAMKLMDEEIEDEDEGDDDDDDVIKFVPPSLAIAGQMIDAYLARNEICMFPKPDITEQ